MAASDGSITGRGTRWEVLHSIWMAWALTLGFLNWIGFLYIGIRVRSRVWVAWGAFYSIPFIFAMLTVEANPPLFDMIGAPITIIFGIAGLVHAFRIRPEYLRRLAGQNTAGEAQANARPFYPPEQRQREQFDPHGATAGLVAPRPPAPSPTPIAPPATPPRATPTAPSPLNLNGATEGELASLPGVGAVLAKRAVTERSQRGGFASVDELGHILELKPHVVERLRPLVTASSRREQSGAGQTGRLIDF